MVDPGAGLSEAQAAAALRIHPKTLARYRKQGLIAHDCSPGGRVTYLWNDVFQFRLSLRRPIVYSAPIYSNMSGAPDFAAR